MKLIIGLGNQGSKYERTRHNVGFMVLDRWADELRWKWSRKLFVKAQVAEGNIEGTKVILAKPTTFMNRSGHAVAALAKKYHIAAQDIIVVYDDVALPLGDTRYREKGSAGGHNGMKSIIQSLGTQEFPRLRVGISEQPERMPLEAWVLGKFTKKELAQIPMTDVIQDLKEKAA